MMVYQTKSPSLAGTRTHALPPADAVVVPQDEYEAEVVRQRRLVAELRAGAEQSRAQSLEERRKRAQAAFCVTENIASEREGERTSSARERVRGRRRRTRGCEK